MRFLKTWISTSLLAVFGRRNSYLLPKFWNVSPLRSPYHSDAQLNSRNTRKRWLMQLQKLSKNMFASYSGNIFSWACLTGNGGYVEAKKCSSATFINTWWNSEDSVFDCCTPFASLQFNALGKPVSFEPKYATLCARVWPIYHDFEFTFHPAHTWFTE